MHHSKVQRRDKYGRFATGSKSGTRSIGVPNTKTTAMPVPGPANGSSKYKLPTSLT